jgi:hypothetical protein
MLFLLLRYKNMYAIATSRRNNHGEFEMTTKLKNRMAARVFIQNTKTQNIGTLVSKYTNHKGVRVAEVKPMNYTGGNLSHWKNYKVVEAA